MSETRSTFVLRPHRTGDMGWVVYRQATVYAEEYGWDTRFEELVARITVDFLANFNPARERCWMAESPVTGEQLGHIFLVQHPEERDTAKLRLLLVESSARGMGLGQALVEECIAFARTAGYRHIMLWTQSILLAARHIYVKAGFHLVSEEPYQGIGRDLISQTWTLEL